LSPDLAGALVEAFPGFVAGRPALAGSRYGMLVFGSFGGGGVDPPHPCTNATAKITFETDFNNIWRLS